MRKEAGDGPLARCHRSCQAVITLADTLLSQLTNVIDVDTIKSMLLSSLATQLLLTLVQMLLGWTHAPQTTFSILTFE